MTRPHPEQVGAIWMAPSSLVEVRRRLDGYGSGVVADAIDRGLYRDGMGHWQHDG